MQQPAAFSGSLKMVNGLALSSGTSTTEGSLKMAKSDFLAGFVSMGLDSGTSLLELNQLLTLERASFVLTVGEGPLLPLFCSTVRQTCHIPNGEQV